MIVMLCRYACSNFALSLHKSLLSGDGITNNVVDLAPGDKVN
jgi:hypothetical protein